MARTILRIATRKSLLALWQAEYVKARLESAFNDLEVKLVPLSTKGDVILDTPLAKVGGKGLFVKELEEAMLEGRADLAVHSMKDVPVAFPAGLGLVTICERGDPRDAFVSNHIKDLASLPQGARVGTSSLRRECQLRALRPDLQVLTLRGNVQTRLKKLDEGQFDAIILAAAGLKRLKLDSRIRQVLPPEVMLPANGQGAIGIECRLDDEATIARLAVLEHAPTRYQVSAERAMNATLEGGCQVPIGGYASLHGDTLWLRGLVGEPDGSQVIRGEIHGPVERAEGMGRALGERLLTEGADKILAKIYGEQQP